MATTPTLDAIMEAPAANSAAAAPAIEPEPARLTVAGSFIHYSRLAGSIERAKTLTENLPGCTRDQALTEALKDLLRELENATKAAQRLIEANR